MPGIERVTGPTLDVLEVLLEAHQQDEELHGWAIIKSTQRAGPTVYRILDRLHEAGWIERRWEEPEPDNTGPRRRYYSLTGEGIPAACALLAERRPATLQQRPSFGFSSLAWLQARLSGVTS